MGYKVFLVEDEIITREGIRDNVDWAGEGFVFCGEAPDGEIALQLIEETKPDVIITDIKMPFMDGLELTRIVREQMPWVKIIVLSGHDEFDYAQSAVKLGVTEYLLKPISASDLHKVLARVSNILDDEKQESERLKNLQTRVEDSLILRREKFLLDLLMGTLSSASAIEQSQELRLDISAKFYLAALIQIELCQDSQPFDYHQYRFVEQIVSEFAGKNFDIFLTKKDFEELVLFIKGDDSEQLISETNFLAEVIKKEIEKQTDCNIMVHMGSLQDRLGNVHLSFFDALMRSKPVQSKRQQTGTASERMDLIQFDHEAVDNYLKFGAIRDFDAFFSQVIQPVGEFALQSYLMKQYLFVALILTITKFKTDLVGGGEDVSAQITRIEQQLPAITSLEQIKSETKKMFADALCVRNEQVNHQRMQLIQQVKDYLDKHSADPDLKMTEIAEKFNLSPNYFSTLFCQEMGESFRDFLADLRIKKAKELLRTTNLKISDVAYQSGYKDAHYFSHVFRKKIGKTPSRFREEPQVSFPEE